LQAHSSARGLAFQRGVLLRQFWCGSQKHVAAAETALSSSRTKTGLPLERGPHPVGSKEMLTRTRNPDSMQNMKTRRIEITLALWFVAGAVSFAQMIPQIGTWKLNEAKSKLTPGMAKNHTVIYEAAGDSVKVIVDGTDADGKAIHNEWTGKFDGKEYPVTGDPTSDARSYRKINDRTLELMVKKDGKVVTSGRIVVSADGKRRTVTTSGISPKSEKFKNTAVYDKE
jgi:hypothetical protein